MVFALQCAETSSLASRTCVHDAAQQSAHEEGFALATPLPSLSLSLPLSDAWVSDWISIVSYSSPAPAPSAP